MKNRDVYMKDPTDLRLANNGVAKVTETEGADELRVLRQELGTFVCKGQYQKGLRTILTAYLSDLDQPEQRGVWVSGFYGSGKSHFVKMLRALWTDRTFKETGDSARTLVKLTDDVRALLVELSTAGKRHGGLHAAAGTLGGGAGSVRLALLAIVFRSVGLPEQYDRARFVMWLRDQAVLDKVKQTVIDGGDSKRWDAELATFVMSTRLHDAIGKHLPAWSNGKDLRDHLKVQFPFRSEVEDADMIESIRFALAPGGQKFPCTLIALDEVQQFIGYDDKRANQVQEVTESVCRKFQGRLMFVGTGQAAITDTTQLQKLQARFKVDVQLSDADVDTVIREIVLLKKPTAVDEIKARLAKEVGEIKRHLEGSKLASQPGDDAVLVADYPLLPVRRRFWERALRAIDSGGVVGQLRNQLTAVLDAVRHGADAELGTVVGADFLYFNLATRLVQTEIVPREVYDHVAQLADSASVDDRLKARLIALAFLIGKLPREKGADEGVRGTADTFADLLVENLAAGSADLRKRIPPLLAEMVEKGDLMQVDDEFRIQTRESSLWDTDYRTAFKSWQDGKEKLSAAQGDMLQLAAREALKGVSVTQGASKVKRDVSLHFGMDMPKVDAGAVPVWVQGTGGESFEAVHNDAVGAGETSPIVFVWLPSKSGADFATALASFKAAEETLNKRGAPTTQAGVEARSAIETRKANARLKLDAILSDILANARVVQAGGEDVGGGTLADAVKAATQNSLVRLFPEFPKADNPKWAQVVQQAKLGQTKALDQVDHAGDPDKHPVCIELLRYAAAGKKGSEIRSNFEAPPYGWSRDAVDGAIFTLVLTEHLRCSTGNNVSIGIAALDRAKIGLHDFRAETVPVTAAERGAVRKLMADAGVTCKSNEEAATLPSYFAVLRTLAASAGGAAPRPLASSAVHIDDLAKFGGNDLVKRTYEAREVLGKDRIGWQATAAAITERLPDWDRLEALLAYSRSLDEDGAVRAERDAVYAGRALLAEPNVLPGLGDTLATALRAALLVAHAQWEMAWTLEMNQLEAFEAWGKLNPDQQRGILARNQITRAAAVDISTDRALLESLATRDVGGWRNDAKALPGRFHNARLEAAKMAEPEVRQADLPKGTLRTKEDVDKWVNAAKDALLSQIDLGPVVV